MRVAFPVLLALSVCAPLALAVELKPATATAFDQYIATLESKWSGRGAASNFIQLADTPERQAKLKAGDLVIRPAKGNGETEISGGIINDWVGGYFLQGATLQQALSVIQDYARNKVTYSPDIVDSVVRTHKSPDDYQIYLRIVKSKFLVTDYLKSEHDIHWTHPSDKRATAKSASTKITEIVDSGKPTEHELPVGNDRGIVWRMFGYWFLEERDGGVYVEYQSITLSRDIPFGMGKVLGPVLHSVPAETLKSSLEKGRRAIASAAHLPAKTE